MKNYYYTDSENRPVGPVPHDELVRLSEIGTIQPETHVIEEGCETWIAFSNLNAKPLIENAKFSPMVFSGGPITAPSQPEPERTQNAGDIVQTNSLQATHNPATTAEVARFDPATIQKFADKLYRQADLTLLVYIITSVFLGIILTIVTFGIGLFAFPFIIIIAVLIARSRALALRTLAQTLLCQVKIEENTRKG